MVKYVNKKSLGRSKVNKLRERVKFDPIRNLRRSETIIAGQLLAVSGGPPHIPIGSSIVSEPGRQSEPLIFGRSSHCMPDKTPNQERGRGGANAKPSELTELERRVLAHERILQALLGHLADDDPVILEQLRKRFGSGHNIGECEQNYVSTDDYGAHFIRAVESEVKQRKRRDSAK